MRLSLDRKNPNQQQVKIIVNTVTRGGEMRYARNTIPNQLSGPRNPYTGKEETNMRQIIWERVSASPSSPPPHLSQHQNIDT